MAGSVSTVAAAPLLKITAGGGNLFQLAKRYLNDATQWNRIASLNGLTDPWLPNAIVTLLIPPVNPSAGGGILGGQ